MTKLIQNLLQNLTLAIILIGSIKFLFFMFIDDSLQREWQITANDESSILDNFESCVRDSGHH